MKNRLTDIYYSEIDGIIKDRSTDIESHYRIAKSFCRGNMERYLLNESSTLNVLKDCHGKNWYYKNPKDGKAILEIGYYLNGRIDLLIKPSNEVIRVSKGDIILYMSNNKIDEFKFKYSQASSVSTHIDLNQLEESGLDKILLNDLEYKNLLSLLKENMILIFKGNKYIKSLSRSFLDIRLNSLIDFLNLKLNSNLYMVNILNYILSESQSNNNLKLMMENIELDILENLSEPPTIKFIEEKYKISPYRLQKLFKENYNQTYYEFVKKSRLEKSIELLEDTGLNIIDISNLVSYENPSKYSHAFKSLFNISPSEYRSNRLIAKTLRISADYKKFNMILNQNKRVKLYYFKTLPFYFIL